MPYRARTGRAAAWGASRVQRLTIASLFKLVPWTILALSYVTSFSFFFRCHSCSALRLSVVEIGQHTWLISLYSRSYRRLWR